MLFYVWHNDYFKYVCVLDSQIVIYHINIYKCIFTIYKYMLCENELLEYNTNMFTKSDLVSIGINK
jgi:hypothetical protein